MLCATCILMTIRRPFRKGPHHASFNNLVKAAQAGCKICKSLLLWRQQHGPDDAGEKETEPFSTYSWMEVFSPVITFNGASWLAGSIILVKADLPHLQDIPSWWTELLKEVKLDLTMEPWRVRPDHFPRRNIPVNTGGVVVSKFVLHCLEKCRTKHSFCRDVNSVREANFLPPRLIEISKDEPPICRLIKPRHDKLMGEHDYVALSHCWGKNPSFLTLKTTNEAQLQENIPIQNLPRNFSEAIDFCKRLGFDYIWIDSLCILQTGSGSEEDWKFHTTIMDAIYANCGLNVAISHASDPYQGCYVDRDAEILQTTFTYTTSPRDIDTLTEDFDMTQSRGELYVIVDEKNDGFTSLSTQCPLNKRGWVFQERLMSPRICHFGSDRIFWECYECSYNEYFPSDYSNAMISKWLYDFERPVIPQQMLTSKPPVQLDEENCRSIHDQWTILIQHYSKTDLTYPSKDKLVAFAAIAKFFSQFLPGKYVAGLFLSLSPRQPTELYSTTQPDNYSIFQFGWYTLHLTRSTRLESGSMEFIYIDTGPLSNAHSPSWSWASMNCGVRFIACHQRRALATIDNIEIDPAEPRDAKSQPLNTAVVLTGPTSQIDMADLQHLVRPESDFAGNAMEKAPSHLENLTVMWFARAINPKGPTSGIILAQRNPDTYRRVGYVELSNFDNMSASEETVDNDDNRTTKEGAISDGDTMPKETVVKTVCII